MKLDYKYIKEILVTMEEYESYQISSYELMHKLGVSNSNKQVDDILLDKFIGHIKLLADNNFIASKNNTLGFSTGLDGTIITANAFYRITSQGYEFLDILKNETILKKISNFALNTAWDIGKQLLINITTGKINE